MLCLPSLCFTVFIYKTWFNTPNTLNKSTVQTLKTVSKDSKFHLRVK